MNPANDTRLLQDSILIKPSTLKEICSMYGMSYKTMRSCLAPVIRKIGPKRGRFFTVHQVRMILDHIGLPYMVKEM